MLSKYSGRRIFHGSSIGNNDYDLEDHGMCSIDHIGSSGDPGDIKMHICGIIRHTTKEIGG